MINAKNLEDRHAATNNARRVRTVLHGQVVEDLHKPWRLDRNYLAGGWSYSFNDGVTNRGIIPETEAVQLLNDMERLYCKEHRNVMENTTWRALYGRDFRQVLFQDPAGGVGLGPPGEALWTYPCHYCGIVLPEELIEIDHQKPASAPGYGVLKLFHSFTTPGGLPLTTGGAHGAKNTQRVQIVGGGAVLPVPVKGRGFDVGWDSKTITPAIANRYTLTDHGQTVLTLIEMMHSPGKAADWGRNSLLNLVPSCARCNNSKTDSVFVE